MTNQEKIDSNNEIIEYIYNTIKELAANGTDNRVKEIKKGDFYAKYRGIDELYRMIEEFETKNKKLALEDIYSNSGCLIHRCGEI